MAPPRDDSRHRQKFARDVAGLGKQLGVRREASAPGEGEHGDYMKRTGSAVERRAMLLAQFLT